MCVCVCVLSVRMCVYAYISHSTCSAELRCTVATYVCVCNPCSTSSVYSLVSVRVHVCLQSCVLPMLVPNGWLACEINQKKGLVPESYLAVIEQNKTQIEQQVSIPEISIQTESTGKENVYGNLEIKSKNMENEDIYSVPRPRSEYVNFENFEDHKGEEGPAHGPSDKTTVLKTVKVTSDWTGSGSNELSLKQDQLVSVLDEKDTWYFGKSGAKVSVCRVWTGVCDRHSIHVNLENVLDWRR